MEPYQELEHQWAKFNGLNPEGVVACSSGTAALHLALEAMRFPLGSRVIVPDFAMIACVRAVTLAGLEPVFVDCRAHDLNIDPELVDRACIELDKIVAVMAVHNHGRRCEMESLIELSGWHGFRVVEDLAEAHGVRPCPGSWAACWSFYKNKIVAGEEGGAVWFGPKALATTARSLRSLGFTEDHDFNHIPRGHNYRMSNAHASIIMDRGKNRWGSIGDARDNLLKRTVIESDYDRECNPAWKMPKREAPWVYDLRIAGMEKEGQDKLVKALRSQGIEARHGFKPLSLQPEYLTGCIKQRFHEAKIASREVIYLPIQPGRTTQGDCRKAFQIIRETLGAGAGFDS